MNLGCSYAQTQMSYDWTIPRDLELTNSDLTQCSITFTNLMDDSTRTFNSNVFNIKAATATMTSSATGPADTSTTNTTSSAPAPGPGAPLSTGAKAGIGVGAAFVALCCALGAYFFLRRRRRRRRRKETTVTPERPAEKRGSGYAEAEMDAGEARQRAELDAQPSGRHAAQELDSRQKAPERDPVELTG